MNKRLFVMIFLLIFTLLPVDTFAANTETANKRPYWEYSQSRDGSAEIPKVTSNDINKWSQKKGFEIVEILQRFAQPFCIIMFIIGGIVAITGSVFNKRLVPKGIGCMAICGLLYAIILFAPDILDNFVRWVRY